jgi:hypothetical protein
VTFGVGAVWARADRRATEANVWPMAEEEKQERIIKVENKKEFKIF